MASIMSLDCTANERASSSTPRLGSRLKMSCRHQSSAHIHISLATHPQHMSGVHAEVQVCLCAAPLTRE